ncbi:pteridine reductase [Aliiglaciecola sp. CAU 1673]|uniref:pteridine reductase n=1 Tax=Aliiglaciecola sp. CAU 1673 TaxID=3032595 RepID=UPI0023DA42FF|nr:pteridine reductase [Aliiglaciecola sp. CAU 1673]MDF2177602.1 pteridine reductase [Aliiglaciecola sp. CAU 1673]
MENKVIFISGSAKRLGAAMAKHLHSLGYNLVLHCRQSTEQAEALATNLNTLRSNSAKVVSADLCDMGNLANLAKQIVACFGRLDGLINNASSFYPTPMGQIRLEDWQQLVGSNLQAPLFLSQYLVPYLRAQGGVIINMVDIHAEKPLYEHSVYCLAKAGLVSLTYSMAVELAPEIRVNGIAPGAILWPEHALESGEKQQVINQIPLKHLGSEQDIAQAVAFLLDAPYITGQILKVDGGRSLHGSGKV